MFLLRHKSLTRDLKFAGFLAFAYVYCFSLCLQKIYRIFREKLLEFDRILKLSVKLYF